MIVFNWLSNNYIEIFGAITGIIYVFLEIRQTIWLWPVGIITSAVYIWIFFTGKLYADMSLQGYYLIISFVGWYWWVRGTGERAQGAGHGAQGTEHRAQGSRAQGAGHRPKALTDGGTSEAQGTGHGAQGTGEKGRRGEEEKRTLQVTRLQLRTGVILAIIFILLQALLWLVLSRFTDSPVPGWDSFITSLSVVATWMLARKIYEHWFLWIVVNSVAAVLFLSRGLYPTVILYVVYGVMSFTGLSAWKKTK